MRMVRWCTHLSAQPRVPTPPTAQPTQRSAGRSQHGAEGTRHDAAGSERQGQSGRVRAAGSEHGAEVLVQREPRADEGRVVERAQPQPARERERALLLHQGTRAAERAWCGWALGLGLGLGLGFGLGFEFGSAFGFGFGFGFGSGARARAAERTRLGEIQGRCMGDAGEIQWGGGRAHSAGFRRR